MYFVVCLDRNSSSSVCEITSSEEPMASRRREGEQPSISTQRSNGQDESKTKGVILFKCSVMKAQCLWDVAIKMNVKCKQHKRASKVVRVDWLGNLANYKEDYNVSLFHVVCTVTVRISRCDAPLVYWPFAYLHLKAVCYLCTINFIFQQGKEQKHITKKVIKFPNQSTLLTLVLVANLKPLYWALWSRWQRALPFKLP